MISRFGPAATGTATTLPLLPAVEAEAGKLGTLPRRRALPGSGGGKNGDGGGSSASAAAAPDVPAPGPDKAPVSRSAGGESKLSTQDSRSARSTERGGFELQVANSELGAPVQNDKYTDGWSLWADGVGGS